ncbi:putative aldouronate transport system substrate-binding protein [Paenibacillus sp. UNCCL117]|uniref:ABC transporter substrate-binding protein n=1 Tax=unclassified Paenibacillus TaxID=185978 RepID=UPI00088DD209|nr:MULTISPECIES: ABC transporter substrate-binding protein [unclassified Paenibacillus]SDC93277.1 carbohydrate ABC transporter substrate-binding protein, CUT1 family [Paenibacillus sp. cl123]SFW29523.1 putative aldouronate transport system substrate-binding protein [Paenibacillus sp. UNCCL117]
MNVIKKRIYFGMIAASLALTGCGGNNSESPAATNESAAPSAAASSASTLPPADLVWYYLDGTAQPDLASVETEVNNYIKPKLNATVKLKPIAGSDYEQKMNTILAAGEAFDIVWTSDWRFNFSSNAQKGAFLELDALLDKNGAKLKASLPSSAWDDVKIGGKIYGVPNYQIAAKSAGFVIQKRFADKYKLDTAKIKTYKDIEPFFEEIKKNEPGIIPFGLNNDFYSPSVYGLSSHGNVISYQVNGGKVEVEDYFATAAYKKHVTMAHEWYTKGYINEDASTLKNKADVEKKGVYATTFDFTQKPGGEAAAKAGNGGNDVIFVPLMEPEFTGVTATISAISRTSKNPERAMMLLELVNTDPALYNLLSFGIENKHYTKTGANTIKDIAGGGYAPNMNWVMGNVTIGYLMDGQAPDTWERTKKANDTAKKPYLYGFKFNSEPVKAEMANLKAVENEFRKVIETGTVDPEKYLPQFLDKRLKAGSEKVLAEYRTQIEAFLKTKAQ